MVYKKVYLFLLAMMTSLVVGAQGLLPDFSTAEDPVWYQVQFKNSGACWADMGADQHLKTASKAGVDAQQWQFIGDQNKFVMKSKKGHFVTVDGGKLMAAKRGCDLKIVESGDGFEIGRVGHSSYMNQWGGAGVGKEIGEYVQGDASNVLSFVPMLIKLPKFSTADQQTWYFLQFRNGMKSLCAQGIGAALKTAQPEPSEEQLWKLVGNQQHFQLVNQLGQYLTVSDGQLSVSAEADAAGFSLVETAVSSYMPSWEILCKGAQKSVQQQAAGVGQTIGLDKSGINCPVAFVDESLMTYPDFKSTGIQGYVPANDLTLWYDQPSTVAPIFPAGRGYGTWMEYALPIGDGQFGASIMGGIEKDELIFNEKTLWSGSPSEYGKYEIFGKVVAHYLGKDINHTAKKAAKDYLRQLDLTTATGKVSFANQAGVKYTREYFASHPARVIVARYAASKKGQLNLLFTLESAKGVKVATAYADGEAVFAGKLQTISYNARIKVVNKGGQQVTTDKGIEVRDADEVLVYLAGDTDYDPYEKSYISSTATLGGKVQARINDAAAQTWQDLHREHVADFQKYFNRVDFQLGETKNELPTNELIDGYDHGRGVHALMLEKMYFAYGRYLEITSSRGVDLPNNLQGIWNGLDFPAWNSDIHANINVQMNYWPAESTNMSEMHLPFLNYIANMANSEQWKQNALDSNQQEGWTCFTENNTFGGGGGFMHNYVIANAWYCTHLWQHYRYTLDKDYLKRVFPAMWTASRFWIGRLKKDPKDGKYVCPLEYSPEHGPGAEDGVAHAQQLVWDLLDNTLKAIEVLGKEANVDRKLVKIHKNYLKNLDKGLALEPYQATGHNGWTNPRNGVNDGESILREWKTSSHLAGDANHRHMSHLMCLYPFSQIHPGTELFDAAVRSMKLRGDGATGWSMGWKINLWARALDGDHARTILTNALTHAKASSGVYYNLFDAHDPFQIDGNFGACAGIAEMVMQSNSDTIRVLPALPSAWKTGHMKGLKAVGDFTFDVAWDNHQPTEVKILSNQGQPLFVHYEDIAKREVLVNNKKVKVKAINANTIKVPAKAKDVVVIKF